MNKFILIGTIHKFVEDDIEAHFNYQKTVMVLKCENGSKTLQYVPIDFKNDNRGLLGGFNIGESVEVSCVPNGREKTKNGKTLYYAGMEGMGLRRTSE